MTEPPKISHLSLKIDGSPAPDDVMGDLLDVTVDFTLHMPGMFTIRLHSHDMHWLEDATFREGKKIEIFMGEPPVKLLSGKIAVLEPELDETSPSLVVRGYDLLHKLYRGRQRRSFVQVTDADLARKLAQECGVRIGAIDSTSEVHEYVFQNNQTNAEFLMERARRIGYELWVRDDQLYFRRPVPEGSAVCLAWGDTLRHFRARLSTAEQVSEVEVRGWDPRQKREVSGRASDGHGAPAIGVHDGAGIAKEAWGDARLAVVDQFVRSPAEAEALAQAALDERAAGFVEAEGTTDANAELAPGRPVQIDGIGTRFGGTYYVTQVVHEWNKEHGFTTQFTASGRRDRGLWSLMEDARPQQGGLGSRLGLVIGIVTNNKDPDELGRVRVKFPWLSAENESAWARVVAPMAGNGRGMLYLPEVDDEVLVGFEHGDIHRPFVIGALWNGKDKLPMKAGDAVGGDGKVNKRILKSRSGHVITLDDTAGGEEISIVDKTGDNKIVFHSPDNSLHIKTNGDMSIEAKGNLSIDVKGKITLKAALGAEMSSDAGFEISGQTELKLSGQASAELSSSGKTDVKGTATVQVDSTGPVKVSGMPIMLN